MTTITSHTRPASASVYQYRVGTRAYHGPRSTNSAVSTSPVVAPRTKWRRQVGDSRRMIASATQPGARRGTNHRTDRQMPEWLREVAAYRSHVPIAHVARSTTAARSGPRRRSSHGNVTKTSASGGEWRMNPFRPKSRSSAYTPAFAIDG